MKTTFDAGFLIPVFVEEVLPGDSLTMQMEAFARLATPEFPFMDNLYLDSQFFFVPNRLLWDKWKRFMGEQANPGDTTDFLVPHINTGTALGMEDGIYDQMGIPPGIPGIELNALHLRAYNLIFNEYYRAQDLQDSVTENIGDGPDAITDYELLRRGKRHDYFTSCLPSAQRGAAVVLPLGTTAPIESAGGAGPTWDGAGIGGSPRHLSFINAQPGAEWDGANPTATVIANWDDPDLQVDLTLATGATINAVREAFALQKLLERDQRSGTRYTEVIQAHWNVTSPDARLQRPEYLGGGTQNITINAVPQTGESGGTPQGNLAAYAVTAGGNHRFNKSFTEHGVILGLVSVRADLTYQRGIERMWSRQTKYDYFWPGLAHLGEQTVTNKEIFAFGTAIPGQDDLVFGYQERWSEYRYKPNRIAGQFRSSHTTPLDVWHLSQDFAGLPLLDSDFIEEDPPIDRVISVPSEPHLKFDALFTYYCARAIPTRSTPGMIDRF